MQNCRYLHSILHYFSDNSIDRRKFCAYCIVSNVFVMDICVCVCVCVCVCFLRLDSIYMFVFLIKNLNFASVHNNISTLAIIHINSTIYI